MQEAYEFLKASGTYYLDTAEGWPKVRIFGTIDLSEGRLYIPYGQGEKGVQASTTTESGRRSICWTLIPACARCIPPMTATHRCSICATPRRCFMLSAPSQKL